MQNVLSFRRAGLLARSVVGLLILAVLLPGAFGSSGARADGGQPAFSLQPVLYDPSRLITRSYFVYDSHPGTILHNSIRVTNSGTAAGTVNLYAVDATTGQTSGLVYLSQNDPRHDVGAWITLGMQHVTLAPGKSQIVSVQVSIPQSIWPGQHVGGIVAESMRREDPAKKSALHIHIQNLAIIAVQINLPGPQTEQMNATGIQASGANNYQTLLVGLHNTGTTMLKSSGSLQIIDAQQHLLQDLPMKLDTFLPHTSIDYPLYVKGKALGPGNYKATLAMTYGHSQTLNFSKAFTISAQQVAQVFKPAAPLQAPDLPSTLPLWQIILGGLLLASGLFFWGQRAYRFATDPRRGNKKRKGSDDDRVPSGGRSPGPRTSYGNKAASASYPADAGYPGQRAAHGDRAPGKAARDPRR